MRNDQEKRNSQGIFSSPNTVQSGPVAHPDSSISIGFFPVVKRKKSDVDQPLHLAFGLEQSKPIFLLPLCVFVTCYCEDFTFTCIESSRVKSCTKLVVH